MSLAFALFSEKPRLRALLDHFADIDDPRDPRRVAHPLPEVLLLVVCGTMADCDDYEGIAAWGEAHVPFLRRYLPYEYGVPGGRWLTLLMNRIIRRCSRPSSRDGSARPGRIGPLSSPSPIKSWDRQDLAAQHDRAAGKAPSARATAPKTWQSSDTSP